MDKKLVFITSRPSHEHTRSYLDEKFTFHDFPVVYSQDHESIKDESVIILDEQVNNIDSISLVEQIRSNNENSLIFLLNCRDLTDSEEEIVNSQKISILSLPVSEVEIFNRIIS